MLSNVVGLVFCLVLLALWLGVRREDRLTVERSCRHMWVLESLYNEGRLWHRRCVRCGKQEPVGDSRPTPQRAPTPVRRQDRHDPHRQRPGR
jgi:Zn ribbon nucleic-acid-binding protein